MDVQQEATELLAVLQTANGAEQRRSAFDRLFLLVYEELRRVAHLQLRHERTGHTLNTTGLVHEAYAKLVAHERLEWRDRNHFLAIAARAMRHILVDYARQHRATKRAGAHPRVSFSDAIFGSDEMNDALIVADERAEELVTLDDALTRLASLDARLSQVVECRFFGGMSEEEISVVLGLTKRTVRRDWVKARAWLARALQEVS